MESVIRDEALMIKVRDGSPDASADAFGELFSRHQNGLLGFCYRLLRNWEDAADVLEGIVLKHS